MPPVTRSEATARRCARCDASRNWSRSPAKSATSDIKSALERDVRLVRFEDGTARNRARSRARQKSLTGELSKKLADWTGRRWMVIVSAEPGQPTLMRRRRRAKAELKDGVRADPLVQAVLARFPGAEIVDVRAGGRRRSCERSHGRVGRCRCPTMIDSGDG